MKKVEVTFGQDMSAYANVDLNVPDNASRDEIIEAIRAFTGSADFEELVFDEDWSTVSSLRVVSVKNGDGYVLEDVPIEPSPFDCGQMFTSWLKGHMDLGKAISGSLKFAGIEGSEEEVYLGTLELPGADNIEVEFKCRKGATQEEKDLAFFQALAQIATYSTVAIGEA